MKRLYCWLVGDFARSGKLLLVKESQCNSKGTQVAQESVLKGNEHFYVLKLVSSFSVWIRDRALGASAFFMRVPWVIYFFK